MIHFIHRVLFVIITVKELTIISATELIKDYMRGKGIVGVCDADALVSFSKTLGDTAIAPFIRYRPEQRLYPSNLLPGAKSIIVLGMGYGRELSYISDMRPRGYFSTGAVGLDYHIGLRALLDGLEDVLQKSGYIFERYKSVDTGPLPEKILAIKAGLGWLGNNGLVINDELGSFFNIGYMITNIEPDEFKGLIPNVISYEKALFCGECNRCVKACPGNALSETKAGVTFDYNKCVSYITQKKGELTNKERAMMGLRLYGCDTCQDACDYNKNSYIGKITDINYVAPRLNDILELSKADFVKQYKSTAIYWRGLGVLKRNAGIALENWKILNNYFS